MTWFMKILDQPIARSVLHFPTAFDIWNNLHERFGQTSGTQIFSIFQQLADTEQGSDSISSFYTKLKLLWDEHDAIQPLPSCVCNGCTCRITSKLLKIQDEQRLIIFLMKLSSSFTQVRSNLLMQYPLPAISHAYRLLIQEEQHRHYSEFTTETPHAFLGNNRSRQHNRLSFSQTSVKYDISRKSRPFCDYCKRAGYIRDKCFKLHGYPSKSSTLPQGNWKGKQVAAAITNDHTDTNEFFTPASFTQEQYSQILTLLSQQQHETTPTLNEDSNNACFLAGKSCLFSSTKLCGFLIVVQLIT
ncbi:uncharacterized protein LOC130810423 [Amaranthus tricolor]|uniref:uncharacterized protein LOC130810423 n=1 Tax=Amaranthus tricolor TaxID=29722 RepID=UPI002590A756|nr:uncharacterized protein LOC130810423 [Amaranthus tricolor]